MSLLHSTDNIVVNINALQQRFNMATTKLVAHIVPLIHVLVHSLHYTWCLLNSCAAPRTRISKPFTVSTGFLYTIDFMWPPQKKSSGGKCGDRGVHSNYLSISARNIGYGDHELHVQNGVVRHRFETRCVDGCPMTHLPIIPPMLLAGS